MARNRAACMGAAVVSTAAFAALRATPAAHSSSAKLSRWEITARVANGSQVLARISNSSTPGHTGSGNIESKWSAERRARGRILNGDVVIFGATGFHVTGTASGKYRGRYQQTGGVTGGYTCPSARSFPPGC